MNDSSAAEYLITLAKIIKHPRTDLVVAIDMTDTDIARVRLALELDRCSIAFKLRAMVEDWGPEQINRELY